MTDKNGKEIKIDDYVDTSFGEKTHRCYIANIVKHKTTGKEIAFVKFEFAKRGGFGSCLVYPKTSEDLTKI